ncbi:MAG: hypothetical protein U9Q39_06455, partial [Pseudomonadota bacterium]|nr:hypothetical protein [Pseudomonadota bacterium]
SRQVEIKAEYLHDTVTIRLNLQHICTILEIQDYPASNVGKVCYMYGLAPEKAQHLVYRNFYLAIP